MDAQVDGPSTVALTQIKALVPGYLLTPFGWAAKPLAAIVESEPDLLRHIFELDRPRMHVIALALAHLDDNPTPHLAPILFRASAREVLQRVVGRAHVGFKGVLRRLPSAVLSRQGYLRLIELLDDPLSAKALHHLEGREITDSIVSILYEAPAVLRPVLAELLRVIESTEKLDHLPDGLRWLVSRGAAASFDALVADLAAHVQPGQCVARLRKLVSELQLPQTLPPKKIGMARRVDATGDIYALAKRFNNCLASYATGVGAGACAIFQWDDPAEPAVCLVTRRGRLGWCLSEALGISNAELDGKQLQEITAAFAKAAVAQYSAVCALECILQADCATRPRTPRQRQHYLEQRLLEIEEAAWIEDVVDAVARDAGMCASRYATQQNVCTWVNNGSRLRTLEMT